jgi:uncharacterized membrane protein YeaQ/YmgE (transglycosylase-associated protein family)
MSLLFFILFGLLVGFVARALMPGRQKMGLVLTSALGVAGSFLGGFLASLVTDERVDRVHPAGIIGSIIGALILLAVVGAVTRRRALI